MVSFENIMHGLDPAEHLDIPPDVRNDQNFHKEFREAIERNFYPRIFPGTGIWTKIVGAIRALKRRLDEDLEG